MCLGFSYGQDSSSNSFSYFDRFGQQQVPLIPELAGSSSTGASPAPEISCDVNYFHLEFVNDVLVEDDGTLVYPPALTVDQRDVVCQVFKDISELIIPVGNPQINIRVGNSATGTSLGTASAYYAGYNGAPEIYDGMVWKYINTGVNPYIGSEGTGTISPFYPFHGYINFNTIGDHIFHTDLSVSSPASTGTVSTYDMYSVAIHEVLHMLGIVSFINPSGIGASPSGEVYTRYDSFLKKDGAYLLSSTDCFDITTLDLASLTNFDSDCELSDIYFQGPLSNEPVFTSPSSGGSHLSHFQNACPSNGFLNYIMNPSLTNGVTFRIPTQEEANVLCDLGYQLGDTFGDGTYPLNFKDDYISCGSIVGGINDTYSLGAGEIINFSAGDLLLNDVNATSVTCLEILTAIDGNGDGLFDGEYDDIFTVVGDDYTLDTSDIYGAGYHVLRYIPEDALGNKGNTTYVIIKMNGYSLCDLPEQAPCNLLCGGDFEGMIKYDTDGTPVPVYTPNDDWNLGGSNSFDFYQNDPTGYPIGFPGALIAGYSPIAPYSGDNYIGLRSYPSFSGGAKREGFYLKTQSPLVIGETYTISFNAYRFYGYNRLSVLGSVTPPCDQVYNIDGDISFFSNNLDTTDPVPTAIATNDCPDGASFTPFLFEEISEDEIASGNPVTGTGWSTHEITFTANQEFEYIIIHLSDFTDEDPYFDPELSDQDYICIDNVELKGVVSGDAGEAQFMCLGGEGVILGGNPTSYIPDVEYQWEPIIGLSDPNIANPIAMPSVSTVYTLTISSPLCDNYVQDQVIVTVKDCCDVFPDEYDFSGQTASAMLDSYEGAVINTIAGTSGNLQVIKINDEFIIDTNINFNYCRFEMGEDARIRFDNNTSASMLLSIRNSILKACDNKMWDGVILNDENQSLTISNTVVRDAKRAIDVSNCGHFALDLNIFRANRNDVRVDNCDLLLGEYLNNISNNSFYNESLLPPFDPSDEALHAVVAKNIPFVNVAGNDVYDYDNPFVFENTDIDIRQNNLTHNATGQTAISILFTDNDHKLVSDNNVISDYNNGMTNTLSGVISSKWITFNITNDSFQKITDKAINFRNAIGRYNYIKTCSFTDVAYGIVVQSTFPPAPISSPAPFIDPGKQLVIYGNSLSNVKRVGIFTTNIVGSYAEPIGVENKILKVIDNDITLSNFISGSQRGVRIEKCYRSRIEGNTITSPGGFPISQSENIKGISVSDSRKANIVGNHLNDLGEALHVVGQNPFTKWECNEMNGCYNGFNFDNNGIGTATYITNQGSPTNPTDNKWIGINGTNVIGELNLTESGGLQPNWYYRVGGIYFPDMNLPTFNFFNRIELANSFELCNGSYPSPDGSGGIADSMVSEYEEMLDQTIVYSNLNESFKYKDKEYVLREIKGKELTGESLVLDNFFDLMEDSGLDRKMNVHRDMELGELQAAIDKNDAWLTENLHEINSKTVNTIYLNSVAIGQAISSDDLLTLESIALNSPYLAGDAVYSARVLLGVDPTDNGIQYREIEESNNSTISIFPNPASAEIIINYYYVSEKKTTLQVFNITGQLLLNESLAIGQEQVYIDLSSLNSGIYFIQIAEDGINILQERLILTQ